jgi:hypothetical protein
MPPKSLYSLHPGFAREAAFEVYLQERTGKTLAEWLAIVKQEGPATEKERRGWLMERHSFTTNYAWWLAERAEGKGSPEDYDPEAYVEAMFAAGKAGLRPLYDTLLHLGLALGPDVKACPCQTIVPLYRTHVFAQFKPSTRTRLDLGLALRDTPFGERLLDTGGQAKKDRITHRIAITRPEEIDDEVKRWLRTAYDLAGTEERKKPAAEVVVPDDLAAALAGSPAARAAFEKLPPSHRREYVESIAETKKPETRARRIAQALSRLEKPAGKKR